VLPQVLHQLPPEVRAKIKAVVMVAPGLKADLEVTVSDKRSHLDLQLNLLSEQENTKMLLMLREIGQAVGAEFGDPELKELEAKTKPEELSHQIDEAANAAKKPGTPA